MTENYSYERNQEAVLEKLAMNLAEYTRRLGGIEYKNINIANSDEISEQFHGMLESVGDLEKAVEKILATSTKPEMPKIEKKSYTTLVYGTGGADSSYEEELQECSSIISQVKDMLLEQKVDLMFKEASNRLINIIEDENFDLELQNLRLKLMTILLSSSNYDRLEYFKEEISTTKEDGFSSGKLTILSALETIEIPYSYIQEHLLAKTLSQKLYLLSRLENDSRYLVIQKLRKEYGIDNAILIFIENSLAKSLEYVESLFAIVSKKLFTNSYEVNIKRIEDSFGLLLLVPKKLLSDKIFKLLWRCLEIENVKVAGLALDIIPSFVEDKPELAAKYFEIAKSFYTSSHNDYLRDCAIEGMVNTAKIIPNLASDVFVHLKNNMKKGFSPKLMSYFWTLVELDKDLAAEVFSLTFPYLADGDYTKEALSALWKCIGKNPALGSSDLVDQAIVFFGHPNKSIQHTALMLLKAPVKAPILFAPYVGEDQQKKALNAAFKLLDHQDWSVGDSAFFLMTSTLVHSTKLFPFVLEKFKCDFIKNTQMLEKLECEIANITDSRKAFERLREILVLAKKLEKMVNGIIANVEKSFVTKL
jgi:hypothetical protein